MGAGCASMMRQGRRTLGVQVIRESDFAPQAPPSARQPQRPRGGIDDRNQGHGDSQRNTRPGSIIYNSACEAPPSRRPRMAAISAVRAHVEVAVRNGLAAVVIPRPQLSA
jgi:hypothetical protein